MKPHPPKPGRSLADLFPEVAAEWHPTKNELTPDNFRAFSRIRVWWLGPCGHEWDVKIYSRTRGNGCPFCSGRKVLAGFNDLATKNPELAAEWHPTKNGDLLPTQFVEGSKRKVWWLGACGHEWDATIKDRSNGDGCPVCAGRRVLAGFNDLATKHPALAAEWHPTLNGDLTPQHVTPGSDKKVWWQCALGHEWQAVIDNRVRHDHGCSVCANRVVLVGFNDLATVSPRVAAEWHPTKNGDLLPTQFVEGSKRKVWWLCAAGHDWEARIQDRKRNNCPTCSASGFSTFEDGWIYLLVHEAWSMQKIGITNHPDQRIEQHGDYGWEIAEIRGPMPGDHIRALERSGLDALRSRGAELGHVTSKIKFDGYTESWPTESLHLESLGQLISWIHDDEASGRG